jgi:outer membrane protein
VSLAPLLRRLLVVAATALPLAAAGEGLLELYDQALQSNPLLRGRVFGIEQAKAQKDLARSQLLPQILADGSYDWNKYDEEGYAPERYEGLRGVVNARQPLFDLPSLHRYRSAKVAVEQSEYERAAVEMEVAIDLIDRYLTVLQAEDEMAYLQSEKTAIESQLKRLRFMRERQLAKVTDLYEVEAYYQSLLTREIETKNARAVALARLRETAGVDVAAVAPLVRDTFPAVPGNEEQWTADAVATNPSLLALQRATESARRLVDSTRTQHLPRLSVSGSQVYSDQGYDNREVPTYQVGSVGLEVSVPIFEGGRVQAAIHEARARHNIAIEQYEAARREVEGNARAAYLNAIASFARTRSTAEETRALLKVVESQERSYELKVTTILDVLVARRRLTKARSDESKARYDYIRDLSTLQAQTGALGRSHVVEIDGWLAVNAP